MQNLENTFRSGYVGRVSDIFNAQSNNFSIILALALGKHANDIVVHN